MLFPPKPMIIMYLMGTRRLFTTVYKCIDWGFKLSLSILCTFIHVRYFWGDSKRFRKSIVMIWYALSSNFR